MRRLTACLIGLLARGAIPIADRWEAPSLEEETEAMFDFVLDIEPMSIMENVEFLSICETLLDCNSHVQEEDPLMREPFEDWAVPLTRSVRETLSRADFSSVSFDPEEQVGGEEWEMQEESLELEEQRVPDDEESISLIDSEEYLPDIRPVSVRRPTRKTGKGNRSFSSSRKTRGGNVDRRIWGTAPLYRYTIVEKAIYDFIHSHRKLLLAVFVNDTCAQLMTWWPELTVDVVESDLKSMHRKGTVPMGEDTLVSCPWVLKPTKPQETNRSSSVSFEKVSLAVSIGLDRLDVLRYNMCMAVFHARMVVRGEWAVSPLDFCRPSAHCICIANLVENHTVDLAQDVKDIQRDSVCVNGVTYNGSDTGYDGIHDIVCSHLGGSTAEGISEIASLAISFVNRTFSGGVVFDQVLQKFERDEECQIVPISNEAEPLDIIVDNGVVLVRGHTRYRVVPETGDLGIIIDGFCLVEFSMHRRRGYVYLDSHAVS